MGLDVIFLYNYENLYYFLDYFTSFEARKASTIGGTRSENATTSIAKLNPNHAST